MATQSKTKHCEESPRSIRLLPKSRTIARPFPPGFTPVIQVSSAPKGTFDGNSILTPVFLSPSLLSPLPPQQDHKSPPKPERSADLSTKPALPALQLPGRNRSKTLTSSPGTPKISHRSPATPGSLRKLCHSFLGHRQEISSVSGLRPPLPTATNEDIECNRAPVEKLSKTRLKSSSQHASAPKLKARYHHSPQTSTGALAASPHLAVAGQKAASSGRLQKAKSLGDLRGERTKSLNQERTHQSSDCKQNLLAAKLRREQISRGAHCEGMPLSSNEAVFQPRDTRKHFHPGARQPVRSAIHLSDVASCEQYVITELLRHQKEERFVDPSILADWTKWGEITQLDYLTANHRLTCLS